MDGQRTVRPVYVLGIRMPTVVRAFGNAASEGRRRSESGDDGQRGSDSNDNANDCVRRQIDKSAKVALLA